MGCDSEGLFLLQNITVFLQRLKEWLNGCEIAHLPANCMWVFRVEIDNLSKIAARTNISLIQWEIWMPYSHVTSATRSDCRVFWCKERVEVVLTSLLLEEALSCLTPFAPFHLTSFVIKLVTGASQQWRRLFAFVNELQSLRDHVT